MAFFYTNLITIPYTNSQNVTDVRTRYIEMQAFFLFRNRARLWRNGFS